MTVNDTNVTSLGDALVANFQAGDLEAALACLHPDVEIHEPESLPYGGTWKGRAGFADLVAAITRIAEMTISGHTAHPTSNGVILTLDLSLTSHATKEVFRTQVVEVDRIEDGLICDIDVFYKDVKATVEFLVRT